MFYIKMLLITQEFTKSNNYYTTGHFQLLQGGKYYKNGQKYLILDLLNIFFIYKTQFKLYYEYKTSSKIIIGNLRAKIISNIAS